jgi:hypothetical protein
MDKVHRPSDSKRYTIRHSKNPKKTKTKLCRLSPRANYTDRRLLAKLVPTFADRG